MTKNKYSLPKSILSEISDTVDLVKNNIGTLNYKVIPLSSVEFDPLNPRDLSISVEDLNIGLIEDDPLYDKKLKELRLLEQMAETIKKYGVRNAIEVYQNGNVYRLIHGERRCLSSILAGKKEIAAKVLEEKPNDFDIRLLQLIENVQRENLSLYETLLNVERVIREYKKHVDPNVDMHHEILSRIINRSRTHCVNLLSVLSGGQELMNAIKSGQINNLEKAAIIAKEKTEIGRSALLRACLDGTSLKQLKEEASKQKEIKAILPQKESPTKNRSGRKAAKINLGSTQKISVVRKLIDLVFQDPAYVQFKSQFNAMALTDFNSCSNSISALIKLMEKIES